MPKQLGQKLGRLYIARGKEEFEGRRKGNLGEFD